jgi:DNA-binding transcriptional LysR family regulator
MFQQLKGFLAVAQTGSFTRGAKKTFRTQSTGSQQVKDVEQALAVKLFERIGTREVRLTRAGEILLELVNPLIHSVENLKDTLNERLGKEPSGQLIIAAQGSSLIHLLPTVVRKFQKKMPAVQLRIVSRNRDTIVELVRSGDANLGITSLYKTYPGITYHPFGRYPRVIACPRRHPLTELNRPITLSDLALHPLILPSQNTHRRRIVDSAFSNGQLDYDLAMEINGTEAMTEYVAMKFGIAVINGYYMPGKEPRNLQLIDVSHLFGFADRGLLWHKDRVIGKAMQFFLDEMTRQASSRWKKSSAEANKQLQRAQP